MNKRKPCLNCVEAMPLDGHSGDCREASAIRNAQMKWNKRMRRLFDKEPPTLRGFSFLPKGDVS